MNSENAKVNLFLVGAMKAGTTSFAAALGRNNDIFLPHVKEPDYFSQSSDISNPLYELHCPFGKSRNSIKPLEYRQFSSLESYRSLYEFDEAKNCKYRMDASTSYLPCPQSANAIYNYNSDSKIIMILRDPLKRALSAHQYLTSRGREIDLFENTLIDEMQGKRDDWVYGWRHLYSSVYAPQVKRYLDIFPKNQILVLPFSSLLVDDKTEVNSKISEFLNIPFELNLSKENQTVLHSNLITSKLKEILTSPYLRKRLRENLPLKYTTYLKKAMVSAENYLDMFGSKSNYKMSDIDPELMAELTKVFNQDLLDLSVILGEDLSW